MKLQGIANYQGVFLTMALGLGGVPAIFTVAQNFGHSFWLMILATGLPGLVLYFFYRAMLKYSDGRDLPEIFLDAWGARSRIIVLALFVAYLLFWSAYFLLAGLELWSMVDGQRNPLVIYVLPALLLCVLTARLGLTTLARLSVFIVGLFILIEVINTLFLLPDMDWRRVLPLSFGIGPHFGSLFAQLSALLFGLLPLTLLFLPRLHQAKQQAKKYLAFGMTLFFICLLLISLRNVLLFGDMLQYENYPSFQALRLVEWSNAFLRLELLGLLAMLAVVLLFCMICLVALDKLVASYIGHKSPYTLPLAALAQGFMMLAIKKGVNLIDTSLPLMIATGSAAAMILLFFFTILTLQKTIAKK